MEQDLNEFEEINLKYFKLEHANQDVHKLEKFKNWIKDAKIYVEKENKRRGHYNGHTPDDSILLISLCKKCQSYSICSFRREYSCIECTNCHNHFCVGCFWEEPYNEEGTSCLKGYLKLLYIRTIYRKSGLSKSNILINIIFIIFSLLFTPLYLGFLSFFLGFNCHSKRKGIIFQLDSNAAIIAFIYCALGGLLMIPYMILFLPFMSILLIPAIFNKKYFYTIFIMYITSLMSDCYNLYDDDYDE